MIAPAVLIAAVASLESPVELAVFHCGCQLKIPVIPHRVRTAPELPAEPLERATVPGATTKKANDPRSGPSDL